MKKMFSILAFTFSVLLSNNIQAIGIEIERGHKEWDADKKKTWCVDRGLCRLKLSVDVPLPTAKPMLINVEGHLVISFPAVFVEQFPEDFSESTYEVNMQIELSDSDAGRIELNGPITIREGRYPIRTNDNYPGRTLIFLN